MPEFVLASQFYFALGISFLLMGVPAAVKRWWDAPRDTRLRNFLISRYFNVVAAIPLGVGYFIAMSGNIIFSVMAFCFCVVVFFKSTKMMTVEGAAIGALIGFAASVLMMMVG